MHVVTARPGRDSNYKIGGSASESQGGKLAADAPIGLSSNPGNSSSSGSAADAAVDGQCDLAGDLTPGYAAEDAARAFGIPRIEPVRIAAARSPRRTLVLKSAALPFAEYEGGAFPPQAHTHPAQPSPATEPRFALGHEDQTESISADEPAAVMIALHAPPPPDAVVSASGATAKNQVSTSGQVPVSDQLTAMLRMPKCREKGAPTGWESGPLRTASMPSLSSLAESTTTTLTLPAATAQALVALGQKPSAQRGLLFVGGALLGGAVVLALWLLPLGSHALSARGRSAAAQRLADPGAADPGAERLIEQALHAVRAGQNAHAAALLLHYRQSRPAGADPAVELMLRVLRKESAAPLPGR